MLLKMIRGVLFHQRGKMLLIAFTIALGASLATGMLNVMMDVGDKVNQELKTYGANITVKPKDASLLSDIYDIGGSGEAITASYLREEDLGKIKTIFWAFNIVDFTPFLDTTVTIPDGTPVKTVGTWFNHHLSLPTGEELDAGVVGMRSWWDITAGKWLNEKDANADDEIFSKAWDITAAANTMTHSAENRTLWTLTIEDVELTAGTILYKVVADNSWDNNWGFGDNNADYVVNMPEGLEKATFDITFYFSPLGLSNGYNVSCEAVYDEETTVGINTVKANDNSQAIYNLQGVRLNKLHKGLNIVGGKKIVVK